MKAVIYRGTDYEISWSVDDQISPELIDKIEEAAREKGIDWEKSRFVAAVDLLMSEFEVQEILDKIYDEEPDLVELVSLAIQHPMDKQEKEFNHFSRLYLPIIAIIVRSRME